MDEPQVIMPVPRPFTYKLDVIEGMEQTADGNSKAVKVIQQSAFYENGMIVTFFSVEFAAKYLNDFTNAYQQAKSPLTIARTLK